MGFNPVYTLVAVFWSDPDAVEYACTSLHSLHMKKRL